MTEHSVEEFIPGLTHRDRGVRVSAAGSAWSQGCGACGGRAED